MFDQKLAIHYCVTVINYGASFYKVKKLLSSLKLTFHSLKNTQPYIFKIPEQGNIQ